MVTLAKMGAAAALGIAAMGSALGCGTAGLRNGRYVCYHDVEEGLRSG